ncbi:TPA: ead/Ea22-like family protein [Klebsiella pneumoniae]|nr:ead/Ea22-like family protein [Klebsiella pneumoniae]
MTDINELAQSLKAAAEKATPGEWVYFPKNTSIEYDVGSDESQGSILYVDSGDFTQVQTDRNGEFIALANPANILALVEALEKAQQVDEELCKLLPPGVEYMDPPDGGDVTPLEGVRRMVADYRQRIAELESRTVTIEPFRSFVTDADLAALHRFAECCDDPESGGHDLEKEQVRRLEEIGALRRHGRVHWITGFGDVLISITSGIKWEAE